jgi:hypothetical protein
LLGEGLGRPSMWGQEKVLCMDLLRWYLVPVPDDMLFMFLVYYEKHINARRRSLLDTIRPGNGPYKLVDTKGLQTHGLNNLDYFWVFH